MTAGPTANLYQIYNTFFDMEFQGVFVLKTGAKRPPRGIPEAAGARGPYSWYRVSHSEKRP